MKNLSKIFGLVAVLILVMSFASSNKKTIVIDVSHGGKDAGALVNGIEEKDIILDIAQRIQKLNKNQNTEIILTRDIDEFLSLSERTEKINEIKPDYVISLHANQVANENVNGIQIFLADNDQRFDKSGELAIKLLQSFTFSNVEIKKGDFYILKNIDAPGALIELGFLSNAEDFQNLTTENGKEKLALSILNALNQN
jgi:N-acetylmuramoyl-L-alanine amidase